MSTSDIEIDAMGYTVVSGVTAVCTIVSAAVFADNLRAWALVVAIGCGFLAVVASRRRSALLKRAEEIRALEKAGLE